MAIGRVIAFAMLGVLGPAAWAQLGSPGDAPAADEPAVAPAELPASETPAAMADAAPPAGGGAAAAAAKPMQRDPFWPVGWTPPPERASALPAERLSNSPIRWEEAIRMVEVTALTELPDGGHVAIVKGIGVVERGDTIAVNLGGLTYRWKVQSITSEGIVPERIGVTAQRDR
jgi:hypothetical protein